AAGSARARFGSGGRMRAAARESADGAINALRQGDRRAPAAALRKPLGAAHVIAKVDRIRARGPRRVNEDATAAGRRLDAVDRQLKRRANRYAGAARHVERASG